jgi:hypothetical protein
VILLLTFQGVNASSIKLTPEKSVSSSSYIRPTLYVPFCTTPPKIDGKLDDPLWKTAAHIDKFFRMSSPVTQQTEV